MSAELSRAFRCLKGISASGGHFGVWRALESNSVGVRNNTFAKEIAVQNNSLSDYAQRGSTFMVRGRLIRVTG